MTGQGAAFADYPAEPNIGAMALVRTLVLSDIHANLEALETVIEDAARRGGFDQVWCLGDSVGYGPDPAPCLELLRSHDLVAVAGNHDQAAAGRRGVDDFNPAAGAAARWTARQLPASDAAFLAALPLTEKRGPFTLVHGSLRRPTEEYLLDNEAARATLALLRGRYCLVGHSHLPFVCSENGGYPRFEWFTNDKAYRLTDERVILNPGSVGQPRDLNPCAGYAVYDGARQTVEWRRVGYDIAKTQRKMRDAGLPDSLIDRLGHGI